MRTTVRRRVAAGLWIGAAAVYVGVEAVAAHALPGYHYRDDLISDLGDPGRSPRAAWMNVAFVVQGLAFAVAAGLLGPTRWFVALAVAYGAGSAVVGAVPSGQPGVAHAVHVGAAVTAIVGGNLAVAAGGIAARRRHRVAGDVSILLAAAGLASGAVLLAGGTAAWERGAVYPIIAWQAAAGVVLLAGAAGLPPRRPGYTAWWSTARSRPGNPPR